MVGWVMTTYHPRTHSRGLGLGIRALRCSSVLRAPCARGCTPRHWGCGVRVLQMQMHWCELSVLVSCFFGRAGYPGPSSLFYHLSPPSLF